jgi:mannose-6-phosphate isomerase-like protein (cupin superfamily)
MRCVPAPIVWTAWSLVVTAGLAGSPSLAQTPQNPPPATQPPPAKPTATPPATPPGPAATTGRNRTSAPLPSKLTLTVMVTAMDGRTLPDVQVTAIGPVEREAQTDPSGLVNFANMAPGTYRVRFEHEGYVTLEKEMSIAAGKPLRANATLAAAPTPPPPPPKVEPVEPTPPAAPDENYSATSMSILDFIEKNYIGGAPVKRSTIACTGSSTSTLIQIKEPIAEHTHADSDEIIYVVAGEGTQRMGGKDTQLSAGVFTVVPRGTSHTVTRRGSRPLIFVSTLSGPPCQPGK